MNTQTNCRVFRHFVRRVLDRYNESCNNPIGDTYGMTPLQCEEAACWAMKQIEVGLKTLSLTAKEFLAYMDSAARLEARHTEFEPVAYNDAAFFVMGCPESELKMAYTLLLALRIAVVC